MKNKIRFRLLLYFSGSLLLFSLIIGVVFATLFSQHNKNIHKEELENRAVHIANSLAGFWDGENQRGQGHSMGMGYGGYLRYLDDIAMTDVWVFDHNLHQITRGRGQTSLQYSDLPSGGEDVIGDAMKGKTVFSESFGSFLGKPSITVAAPVILANGEIVGAVLLHEEIENIRGATSGGLMILLFSMAAAIVLSFFIATGLSTRFTKPLQKMKSAAIKISSGDYKVKTGVEQKDEIGELAKALDDMAGRLHAASEESMKLDKLRRDYVANISHELRTPVTVIRGSLEALCEGVVNQPEMVEDYHQKMLAESIYLQRLVSDLLDLARLQNPDLAMEMGPVNIKDVVEDAVGSVGGMSQEKSVDIQFTYEGKNLAVIGDYGRLRQLFLILLDNAIKFSPNGGVVQVSLHSDDRYIRVSVRDTGPGIDPEDLPYIFDRFYKQRSEENKSGTGLGLVIAREIAQRHRATIEGKNREGSPSGSVFTLTIETVKR